MTDHEHNFLCPILCDEYQAENAERDSSPPRDADRDPANSVVFGRDAR